MSVGNSRSGRRSNGVRIALFCASAAAVATGAAVGCSQGRPTTESRDSETHESEAVATATHALVPTGSWTPVAIPYPSGGGPAHMQLLMDGSILATDGGASTTWRRYFPDPVSGYVRGTWVNAASTVYGRAYFATGMLRDGRFLVCGGEYFYLNGNAQTGNSNKCELFDPSANTWTSMTDFPGNVIDGHMSPRADGRLLVAPGAGSTTIRLFDPTVGGTTWTAGGSLPGPDFVDYNEGALTQLQNGNLFFSKHKASIYNTSTSTWSAALALPANSPYGDVYCSDPLGAIQCSTEGAPVLTLYDGRVLITGSTGRNAIYNPSSGTITQVADTPGVVNNVQRYSAVRKATACTSDANCVSGDRCLGDGKCATLTNLGVGPVGARMDENDQAVLPNGNVLAAVIRWDFGGQYSFYEYSPVQDSFTPLSSLANAPVFVANNLLQTPLPDGGMLVANAGNSNMFIYRPTAQNTSFGQPTISNVTGPVAGEYTMTGTTLNGLTNGANRDDEGQNNTNFPIVWVNTFASSAWPQRRYCTVTSVSSASIAPGASVTVKFRLPAGLPRGSFTLGVSASGLQSSNTFPLSNGTPYNLSGQRGELLLE